VIFNDNQRRWWGYLQSSGVSKDVALRWARIQMGPDRASKIWRGLRRKGVPCGCMSGLVSVVRWYLLDAGRWREVYEPSRKERTDV
jgi:hypothetical protein